MSNATPKPTFAIDTIGLVLHLEKRKLSVTVSHILQQVEAKEAVIYIPAIVFAEILYLSEKKRIELTLDSLFDYLSQQPNFLAYPLNPKVIRAAQQISDIPELHDRLIAATAKTLGHTLITNDQAIQTSSFVQTIW